MKPRPYCMDILVLLIYQETMFHFTNTVCHFSSARCTYKPSGLCGRQRAAWTNGVKKQTILVRQNNDRVLYYIIQYSMNVCPCHHGMARPRFADGGRPGLWAQTACSFRSAQAATLLEFMYHSRIVLSVGVLCGTWSETSVAQSQLTQFWQFQDKERFLFHCERHFSSRLLPSGGTWKYAKAPSTKKKLGLILYLLICSFLPCLSWLLRSRVRKSRRDLRITLYILFAQAFIRIVVKEKAREMYNMPQYISSYLCVALFVAGKCERKNMHWKKHQEVILVVSHREFLI